MKGITPVVSVIMLLMITISMVGFAYYWFSSVWKNVSESTQNSTDQRLIQMGQKIDIIDPTSEAIGVRNIGTHNIPCGVLSLYVNGVLVDINCPGGGGCEWSVATILPHEIITAGTGCTCNSGEDIVVYAPGNVDHAVCS